MLGRIVRRIWLCWRKLASFLRIRMDSAFCSKRIYLLGTPWYGNIGDQAITLGELHILRSVFPDFKIVDVPYGVYYSRWAGWLGLGITEKDIIFMQGGGNLGSLYPQEEKIRRDVVRKYKDNKIVIMPVSIYFHDNSYGMEELRKSREVYESARDLTIISRDENSWNFASENFVHVHNILAPDAATSLEGMVSKAWEDRKDVMFFLRSDKEKVSSDTMLNNIKEMLSAQGISYHVNDTTVLHNVYDEERHGSVSDKLGLAASSRLVITDRFHGVVFSVITHTPVIAFKSFDTKISAGIKWFKDLPWVYYMEGDDLKDVEKIVRKWIYSDKPVSCYSDCGEKIIKCIRDIVV